MKRIIKTLFLSFSAYLIHVCVMPYLPIAGVRGNVMISVIAIITVSYGWKFAVASATIIGVLMETMSPSLTFLYLIAYPAIGILNVLLFADKSERRMEQERNLGKKATNLPAGMRCMLGTIFITLILEIVQMLYSYLNGIQLTFGHYSRALISILYTLCITFILLVPIRRFLGVFKMRKKNAKPLHYNIP